MTKIFITGDAYMSATYPTLVAIELIKAARQGHDIVTVDYSGAVPMITRGLAEASGLELTLVSPLEGEDLDTFHQATLDAHDPVEVVMIHDEPMVSTVYQSLARVVSDDKLRLASYADLLV